MLTDKAALYDEDTDLAYEELVADACEQLLLDSNAIEKIVLLNQKDSSIVTKIKEFLTKLLAKVRGLYKDITPDPAEARAVREMEDVYGKLLELFEDAAVSAVENKQAAGKTFSKASEKGNIRYSKRDIVEDSKRFSEQIDNIQNIPSNNTLVVCGTPKVFIDIGLNNLPMTINQKHVMDAVTLNPAHKDRYIGKAALKSLPSALESPIAIIASKTHSDTSLVAIVDLKGQNGKSIITPIYLNGKGLSNGILMDVNAVSSVHERKNAVSKLLTDALNDEANKNIGVFYLDNKKATQLARFEGLQLPNIVASLNGFIHSIYENNSPVKSLFKRITQTETQQFKHWFDKSKVVDEDGNPLIVYHGTDADFFEFDMSKGRANMDIQGAFLSPYELDAQGYGKNVGSFYLSLQNPADESTAYRALNRFKGQNNAGIKAREYLIKQGYDGVYNGYDEYIAFYPGQIKSATDNIGTFDGNDPDIRYSLRQASTRDILANALESTIDTSTIEGKMS